MTIDDIVIPTPLPTKTRAAKWNTVTEQKYRGGYYTPRAITSTMAKWAVKGRQVSVLEPSAGDGEFIRSAAREADVGSRFTAVELHRAEADKIRALDIDGLTVLDGDLFEWLEHRGVEPEFDVVLGNPPFIRYQHFDVDQRERALDLMRGASLKPNRLTNAWVPFVVASVLKLKLGGRLAMVLPAELLQVGYAAELRGFLAREFSHLTIVTFKKLVFTDILQETVLILGIREPGPAKIAFIELEDESELSLERLLATEETTVDLDHATEKWTQYYLSATELSLIRSIDKDLSLPKFREYGDVDVGVVTGRNEFFVMTPTEAEDRGLIDSCVPLVGRSFQTPGVRLSAFDFQDLVEKDSRCLMLQLGNREFEELTTAEQQYVRYGEANEFHTGYKCRIRMPRWWRVPSAWVPDGFLLRQIYDGPRLIVNEAAATSTDTIHRVRSTGLIPKSQLAALGLNSLIWCFTEIRGRSYGGGVLELEPNEADEMPAPKFGDVRVDIEKLDSIARNSVEDARIFVDQQLLPESGFTRSDILMLEEIWRKLSGRRRARGRRS